MSKLTEQLREALDTADGIKTDYAQIFAVIMLRARALLTEHERLEREAEAGKVLANEIEKIAPTTDARGSLDFLVYQYRTACEK